ncbi:hypothetical protein EDC94DRAFT_598434 [Helicostylum pulchrum]|nr:hypothetical protein EDC94DRAFT_598434 [Helicostylum pulchrum]
MTQTTENAGYFNSNHHSVNKPTRAAPSKSGLLNRRQQQQSNYLPQLELPSLPPLSQLLTAEKAKKDKENIEEETTITSSNGVITSATVAAAVAAGIMPELAYTTVPVTQPIYYNNNNNNSDFNHSTASYATNGTMSHLMDPVPANNNITNTSNFTTNPINTMMPLDSIYNLQPGMHPNTNTDVMVAAPNTFIKYEDLPSHDHHTSATGGNGRQRQLSSSSTSSTEKIYSFVAIPGTNQKKRPRRRFDEIERLYHCNQTGCTKAYGTLNHLNAHVSMQKHGSKRHPSEFKEMRKEWRRQKKERETRKKANEDVINNQQHMINNTSINNNNSYNNFQPYGQLPPGSMSLNGFY